MNESDEKYASVVSDSGSRAFWMDVPLLALIAANTIPFFGVLFLKWDVFYILFLYWAENLAIGFYNILKMAFVKVKHPVEHLGKLFVIPFFMVHYGLFTTVHGVFIFGFFGKEHMVQSSAHRETWPCFFALLQNLINVAADALQAVPQAVRLAVLSLFISHGVSFVYNYLIKGEYARIDPGVLMGQPYVRVIVMHITVLIGGILFQVTGSPAAFLIILVALKTGIDIKLHNFEHKKITLHN